MEMHDHKNIEKDELTGEKILAGHEYDNIRELDNNLPRWWVWLSLQPTGCQPVTWIGLAF